MIEFEKEIFVQYKYLHLPIRNGSDKIVMQMLSGEKVVREFDVELALVGTRDWWAFYDISAFKGTNIILRTMVPKMTEAQASLLDQVITQSDDLLYHQDLYGERYRPQFHFTPKRGWSNDPNGLVYYHGIWHLFFQHNPFGINWGSMHWGHAISSDLVHWVEQPIVLYPCSMNDMAFSGGAFIDTLNASGFQTGENEPFILEFTSTGRGECLAFSLDKGRTFQEYSGNPVLIHKGRDPKIIWYAPLKKWIMIVYDEKDDQRGYDIYDSPDIRQWHWLQHLPNWYECPEFFSLPVEGSDVLDQHWLIYGSIFDELRSAYQLGRFDGNLFSPVGEPQMGHAGPHFYAAQIFSNVPDDRKIMFGWLAGAAYPGMPFGNGMTVPLEVSLRKVDNDLRLCFFPVKELEALRVNSHTRKNMNAGQANEFLNGLTSELMDIEITIDTWEEKAFRIDVGGYPIVYDPDSHQVAFAERVVQAQPGKKDIHLRLLIDRAVTEVFVDHGWGAFASMTIFDNLVCGVCIEGDILINSLEIHTLRSIWNHAGPE